MRFLQRLILVFLAGSWTLFGPLLLLPNLLHSSGGGTLLIVSSSCWSGDWSRSSFFSFLVFCFEVVVSWAAVSAPSFDVDTSGSSAETCIACLTWALTFSSCFRTALSSTLASWEPSPSLRSLLSSFLKLDSATASSRHTGCRLRCHEELAAPNSVSDMGDGHRGAVRGADGRHGENHLERDSCLTAGCIL
jgi:hypothetical protein